MFSTRLATLARRSTSGLVTAARTAATTNAECNAPIRRNIAPVFSAVPQRDMAWLRSAARGSSVRQSRRQAAVSKPAAAPVVAEEGAPAQPTTFPPGPVDSLPRQGPLGMYMDATHPTLAATPPAVTPATAITVAPNSTLTTAHPAYAMFARDQVAVVRQLEMMNLMLGFEQANAYTMKGEGGQDIGHIIEEDSLARSLLRNFLTTHRKMSAKVVNLQGEVVLKIHRPFNWINSTIYITTADDREIGHVEQEWHLWRRRYNLFNQDEQFARIDAPILSWEFPLHDEDQRQVGMIDRNFTGFGRELFTDTGHYAVHFQPDAEAQRPLTLDERAIAFAAAITIDFDYFSRDRNGLFGGGGGGGFPLFFPGFWGGEDVAPRGGDGGGQSSGNGDGWGDIFGDE
ncbi:hypothetical protein AMAG_03119 [Allomyces macrogynus ATCC 38327]|uniref:Phospholipid scramblase n=1 Tax=Allomyces macrogynus (strain ATCC 38327) TaxID=578462 RepID=A0A0L0S4C1_ALLM3|nr:hypothetical protein AMAG_03119 [Allomyces macrogynus ATCC 38327]|eukprot:KNE57398.1 hypothetical protein AMAG_03119 [Allomyces macrogynus ATCC 38327]